jgi:hypothetical protein
MILDLHTGLDYLDCLQAALECPLATLACKVLRSEPNILWAARGWLSEETVPVAAKNQALLAIEIWIRGLTERHGRTIGVERV